MREIHEVVYDKPYDINPRDWVNALFRRDNHPQQTDSFWCSAFVGYVLTKIGILDSETDWTIMRPSDFALDGENLNYSSYVKLQNEEFKLLSYRPSPKD